MAGVEGVEPTTHGFGDRCSTAELHPYINGAVDRSRTGDLRLTMALLYQLSYNGLAFLVPGAGFEPA